MLTKTEEMILKKIAHHQLITKAELVDFLNSNGKSDSKSVVESVTRSLIGKKMISSISPAGSTCFVITSGGTRALSDKI